MEIQEYDVRATRKVVMGFAPSRIQGRVSKPPTARELRRTFIYNFTSFASRASSRVAKFIPAPTIVPADRAAPRSIVWAVQPHATPYSSKWFHAIFPHIMECCIYLQIRSLSVVSSNQYARKVEKSILPLMTLNSQRNAGFDRNAVFVIKWPTMYSDYRN